MMNKKPTRVFFFITTPASMPDKDLKTQGQG
jgi:hypothetical protein